jgi:hypothetical protein
MGKNDRVEGEERKHIAQSNLLEAVVEFHRILHRSRFEAWEDRE